LLKFINVRETSNQFAMVQPINVHNLRSILRVLLQHLC
jgi:hypothetical protein